MSLRLAQDPLHARRLTSIMSSTEGRGGGSRGGNGRGVGRGRHIKRPSASQSVDVEDSDDRPLSDLVRKRSQQAKAAERRSKASVGASSLAPTAEAKSPSRRLTRFRMGVLSKASSKSGDTAGGEVADSVASSSRGVSSQAVQNYLADPVVQIHFSPDDEVSPAGSLADDGAGASAGSALCEALQALHSSKDEADEADVVSVDDSPRVERDATAPTPPVLPAGADDVPPQVNSGLQDLFKPTDLPTAPASSKDEFPQQAPTFTRLLGHDGSIESNVVQSLLERFSLTDTTIILEKLALMTDFGVASFHGCHHVTEVFRMCLEQLGMSPTNVHTLMSLDICSAAASFCEDIICEEGVFIFKGPAETLATEAHIESCPLIPHVAIGKSVYKNFTGLFESQGLSTQAALKKLGGQAGCTLAFLDSLEAVDTPFFVWEFDQQVSVHFWKGIKRAQARISECGFANRVVELSANDMRVPYSKSAVYIFGISPTRFGMNMETATGILDSVTGYVDRLLDESHSKHVLEPGSFCHPNDSHEVLHVRKELVVKPVTAAGIPMAFFEKLHSKGITPSDCVPNKAFRASPWFGVFTEKDKALVSHDRMVHGIKGASTVFATDLLTRGD